MENFYSLSQMSGVKVIVITIIKYINIVDPC